MSKLYGNFGDEIVRSNKSKVRRKAFALRVADDNPNLTIVELKIAYNLDDYQVAMVRQARKEIAA